MYNIDSWGEVVNGDATYDEIASQLNSGKAVLIGWTDGEGTHFDILFTRNPVGIGNYQGGVRRSDLFVSIMRVGSFGFEVNGLVKFPGYIEEKMTHRLGSTAQHLADLINAVIARLGHVHNFLPCDEWSRTCLCGEVEKA